MGATDELGAGGVRVTEFQELVKDAPNFASMERGELAIYAYAMYAAGAKMDAENAKLRELVRHLYTCMSNINIDGNYECFLCEYENTDGLCDYERLMRELGVEVE